MENLNKFFQFVTSKDYFNNVLSFVVKGDMFSTGFIPQAAPFYVFAIILIFATVFSFKLKSISWWTLVVMTFISSWIAVSIHAASYILYLDSMELTLCTVLSMVAIIAAIMVTLSFSHIKN